MYALSKFRIFLSKDKALEVFKTFDDNDNGVIELVEFIDILKG